MKRVALRMGIDIDEYKRKRNRKDEDPDQDVHGSLHGFMVLKKMA
jgi:hypothetical protein